MEQEHQKEICMLPPNLLGCPFCGEDADEECLIVSAKELSIFVRCRNCKATGPKITYAKQYSEMDAGEHAINLWNNRINVQ